jgi:hypothetical protein
MKIVKQKKPWLIKNQGFDVFVAGAGLEPKVLTY